MASSVEIDHLAPTSNANTMLGSGLNSSLSSSIIDGKKMMVIHLLIN